MAPHIIAQDNTNITFATFVPIFVLSAAIGVIYGIAFLFMLAAVSGAKAVFFATSPWYLFIFGMCALAARLQALSRGRRYAGADHFHTL
jgi:hypothetical protein